MFRRPVRPVSRVFLHCSASDIPGHANVQTIRRWHQARGFADIGYHFLIDFDGQILPGRSLERVPAAQRGHNTGSIAICLSGGQNGGESAFTAEQFRALRNLCRAINDAYEGRVTFHGHSEVANKACPVFDYAQVLGLSPSGNLKMPRSSLKRSRTVRGSRLASAGAALTAIETVIPEAVPISTPTPEDAMLTELLLHVGLALQNAVPWLAIMMILLGVGWVLFARLDDFDRGLR